MPDLQSPCVVTIIFILLGMGRELGRVATSHEERRGLKSRPITQFCGLEWRWAPTSIERFARESVSRSDGHEIVP